MVAPHFRQTDLIQYIACSLRSVVGKKGKALWLRCLRPNVRQASRFCGFNVRRLVAVACGLVISCNVLNPNHAEAAGNFWSQRNITYQKYFRPVASSRTKANPVALLRNDGRPFKLHIMPNDYSFVRANLYPHTRFVELLGGCSGGWCYVRHGDAVGWLSTNRFLRDPSGSPNFLSQMIETAETDESSAQIPAIPPPVRKSLVPFPPQPSVAGIPTVAVTKDVQAKSSQIERKNYALKEMGGKIFLAVQESRTESSRILGTIPFFARNIEALGVCIDDWCLVRRGSLQGWVRQRHLTDTPIITEPRLQLEPIMPVDALNIYSAPNKGAKLVAKIEAPVTDIKPLGTCDEQWCYIRHLDTVGWVEPRYLTQQ